MTTLERTSGGSKPVTWSGSATSSPVTFASGSVFSLYVPNSFAGTLVTFEAEEDDGSWTDVHYAGEALSTLITAGARNILPEQIFCVAGGRIRFVSDASETLEGRLYLVK